MTNAISTDMVQADGSAALSENDYAILNQVEGSLTAGLLLKAWLEAYLPPAPCGRGDRDARTLWERERSTGNQRHLKWFSTALSLNRPDVSAGFFGEAQRDGRTLPVLGDVQDLFYDRPKGAGAAGDVMRKQLREFVLHYFMRVSSTALPKAFEPHAPSPPAYLNPLGLCPGAETEREGFGQTQLYYKLRKSGQVGKFPESQQKGVVDLREIGKDKKYEWIVVDIEMFAFDFAVRPAGVHLPYAEIPLPERQLAVISEDLITDKNDPEPGVLGEYGYGLTVIKSPQFSLLDWGPGYFSQGFMTYTWRVMDDGAARVRLVFLVNRPERLVNPALDPSTWVVRLADRLSFGVASRLLAPVGRAVSQLPLAIRSALVDPVFGAIAFTNLATFGLAANKLCVSRDDLEKLFLFYHYVQIYTLITNSTFTWRQFPDWLDTAALPHWVTKGGE